MAKKRQKKQKRRPQQYRRFAKTLYSYEETCKTQACVDRAKRKINARGWYVRTVSYKDGTDIYLAKPTKTDKYGDPIPKGGRMDRYGVLITKPKKKR